jgi:molecular chaperone DnaK
VSYDINADGILNVSAKDMATGNQQKITITASTKLSKEDKEKMINEAEQFAEQDRIRKEEAETRNQADSLIYTSEKTLKDLGDKITNEQKEKLEKAATELRTTLSGKEFSTIKEKMEDLSKILQEVGTAAYQKAAETAQTKQQSEPPKDAAGAKEDAAGAKEKVVDADYKVVEEDKKE